MQEEVPILIRDRRVLAIHMGMPARKNSAQSRQIHIHNFWAKSTFFQKRGNHVKRSASQIHTTRICESWQTSTSKQYRPSTSPQSDESDVDSSTTDDEDNSEEISQVSSQVSTNDDRQCYKQRFHLMKSKYLETVQELQDLKESYERSVQTVKFKTIELAS